MSRGGSCRPAVLEYNMLEQEMKELQGLYQKDQGTRNLGKYNLPPVFREFSSVNLYVWSSEFNKNARGFDFVHGNNFSENPKFSKDFRAFAVRDRKGHV